MKGKVTIMGAGFLLATGLTVAAYAQAQPTTAVQAPAKAEAVRSKADMLAMANAQFDRMDANRDGRIDANDRRAQTKARFAEIDADKNGSISGDEFAQAHSRPMASGKGEHKRRHGAGRHGGMRGANGMMLRMADANGDGAVTRAELTATIDNRFTMADSNKDGQVDRDERRAMHKMMRQKHRNMPKG